MNIKVHLSGVAIAYENTGAIKRTDNIPAGRPQGSLYGQQKRAIADAVEYMRLCGQNKPLFFVATSPGFIPAGEHAGKISKFTHNLRSNYGLKDYVWVRELTKNGCPHYHFVADMPFISNPAALSRYWSGLFGRGDQNSIRLGTKPINGVRKFYVDDRGASRYVSKYIGKDLDKISNELLEAGFPAANYRKMYRSFAISENARLLSQPVVYEANYYFQERLQSNYPGQVVAVKSFVERRFENSIGESMQPEQFRWKRMEPHSIFIGFKD